MLVDSLAANPYITAKEASCRLDIAFTTAQRAIQRLETLSIVNEISRARRDRVYCATSLLEMLEEPAKLK